MTGSAPAVVVGGGLAGLAAAALVARKGRPALLFEQARDAGGRARTQAQDGFLFNLGPHALYQGGRGTQVLRELGVELRGGVPPAKGHAVRDGARYVPPAGPGSLLATGLFGWRARWEMARLFVSLPRLDP